MLASATELFPDQFLLKFADQLSPSQLSGEEQKVTQSRSFRGIIFFHVQLNIIVFSSFILSTFVIIMESEGRISTPQSEGFRRRRTALTNGC